MRYTYINSRSVLWPALPITGSDRKSGWGAIPGSSRRVRFLSPLCSSVRGECGEPDTRIDIPDVPRLEAGPGVAHPRGREIYQCVVNLSSLGSGVPNAWGGQSYRNRLHAEVRDSNNNKQQPHNTNDYPTPSNTQHPTNSHPSPVTPHPRLDPWSR
jgi:hypothetical protein